MAPGGGATLLSCQGPGGWVGQENAEDSRKGQGRLDTKILTVCVTKVTAAGMSKEDWAQEYRQRMLCNHGDTDNSSFVTMEMLAKLAR